jgi:hypothetical protein
VGLALLDKIDRTLGRRPARKKATGQSTETVLQGSCGEYLLNAPLIVIQNDADVTEAKAISCCGRRGSVCALSLAPDLRVGRNGANQTVAAFTSLRLKIVFQFAALSSPHDSTKCNLSSNA